MSENKRNYPECEGLIKLHQYWEKALKRYERTLKFMTIDLIIELKKDCNTYRELFEKLDAFEGEILCYHDNFPELRKKVFEDIRMQLRKEMNNAPLEKITFDQLMQQFDLEPLM